jgi:hypothetical protein
MADPMTTTSTPVRITREDPAGMRFIVAGDKGAVECRTLGGSPVLIDYHSPRPQYEGDEGRPCDVIAGECYPDAGAGVPALRSERLAAGCDDEVLWADLEKRYEAWGAGR